MKTRVLLVDDHTMFREALQLMLEREPHITVVGTLGDGASVEQAVADLSPDVVVMDVSMPGVNGIVATRALCTTFEKVRVVALSAFCYKQFVMEMLDAGALGYVVKSAAGDQLVHAIASAVAGKTYLCPEAADMLVEASRRSTSNTSSTAVAVQNKRLGRRESQVLRLLAQGLSSPKIGETLHIATSTVDVHRRNIMTKLDIHTVAELTKYALRAGLVDLE
jgi:two-component system NarL family response regulator